MLRIATVEDDANDLEALRTHLSRYEKENGLKFQVTEFRDGEDIVTDYSADYDLILMDIEMAFLNGMKAAEIRELDKDVIIIFITNMPQYAIQGYKVNALDYMLKPISYFSFSESMGRALHRVNVQEKETGRRGVLEIKTSEIMSQAQKAKWNGRIPDNYYVQVLHYLLVTEFDFVKLKAHLRWNIDGEAYIQERHYHIERSDVQGDIDYLEASERRFYEHIINKQCPALILPEI